MASAPGLQGPPGPRVCCRVESLVQPGVAPGGGHRAGEGAMSPLGAGGHRVHSLSQEVLPATRSHWRQSPGASQALLAALSFLPHRLCWHRQWLQQPLQGHLRQHDHLPEEEGGAAAAAAGEEAAPGPEACGLLFWVRATSHILPEPNSFCLLQHLSYDWSLPMCQSPLDHKLCEGRECVLSFTDFSS